MICVCDCIWVCLGSSFPPGFIFLIQKVFVMLFRMLAHLFSTHYQDAVAVELHPHLNTLFTHFITFSHTFRLLEPSETAPIDEIIALLTHWNTWKVTQKDTSLDLESQMWYSVALWTQRIESPHQMHYFGQQLVTWRIPSMFWPSRKRMCKSTSAQIELWLNSAADPTSEWFFFFWANFEHWQFSLGQWPHGLSTRCNF